MEIEERINAYWSERSDEFSDARMADLKSCKREMWSSQIKLRLPERSGIRALDLGTGAGYFAFILRDLGCNVTGIDYSQRMVDNAVKNSVELGYDNVLFLCMDAQALDFHDESFDFIFSRNVTWTLPDPARAYAEMFRVLKPGGRIMNCDANYGAAFREADRTGLTEKSASDAMADKYLRPAKSLQMLRERNGIAEKLDISYAVRPQWDVDTLIRLGASYLQIDMDIGSKVIPAEEAAYNAASAAGKLWNAASPLFMIMAVK